MAAPSVTVLAGTGSTTNATSYTTASVTATAGKLVLIWLVHGRGGGAIPGDAVSVAGTSITGAVKFRSVTFDTLATPISKAELWAAIGTGSAGALIFTFPQQQSGCVWSIQRVNGANTSVETLGIRQVATNRGDAGNVFSTALSAFGDAQNFVLQMTGHTESTSAPEANWTELTDAGITSPTLRLASSWRDANDTSPTTTLDSAVASAWPDATNSGLLVATTRTEAGAGITDTSWFTSRPWVTGTGTQANPYVVDRVLFTSQVYVGQDFDPNNLAGVYVRFTNCRFRENGGDPTPGGSAGIWIRTRHPAHVSIEDSTVGPNQNPLPTGGTTTGTDKGIYSYGPFTVLRCNVYGSNVPIGFETERTEAASLIQDCFLHDIWSATTDHTDIINGNLHASNITVRHCYMDGIRVGGAWVTNGFGIYDDPATSAGIIENWTIDNNYITRCNWQLLASGSTSRFVSPFVVTDNVWTDQFQSGRFNARSPSVQSGNVDQDGNPLTF